MGALGRAVEWLRPLVDTKEWDFCVVWKLGDDPSRFIEWTNCCCGGGDGGKVCCIKEEGGLEAKDYFVPLCRDFHFQHPIRTIACEKLAQYPLSMPLSTGTYGEVAVSNQARWHSYESTSTSNNETVGTQVVIPVLGGLIELFSAKNVPHNQKLIEVITAHCNVSVEQELTNTQSMTDKSLVEKLHDPLFVNQHLNFIPRLQNLITVSQANPYHIDGSSTGSTPSNEHLLLKCGSSHVSPALSPNKSIENSSESWMININEEMSKNEVMKAATLLASQVTEKKNKLKGGQKTGKEPYQSKNLVTERKRRVRIKEGLFALRALVPNITKMDKAAILGDAIDYIHELEKTIKEFQAEFREMEEEDNSKDKTKIPGQKDSYKDAQRILATGKGQGSAITDPSQVIQHAEVEVEINRICQREFLLKFIYSQKRGGFLRLMKVVHSIGFQVIDANVTTCNGRVLNILKVEGTKEEVEPKKLKDLLLKSWTML